MPRHRTCCVGNCQNSRQDAILYKIPENEKRLKQWLKCLGRVCDVENLVPGVSVVCKTHFEARFITSNSRLIVQAYPSLFTSEEILAGAPSSLEHTQENRVQEEHNYSRRKRHCDHSYCKETEVTEQRGTKILKEMNESSIESITIPGHSRSTSILQTGCKSLHTKTCRNLQPELEATASTSLDSNLEIHLRPEIDEGQLKEQIPSTSSFRKRLVHKSTELTPLCQRIYKEYKKAKKQLSFHKRAKDAMKFCRETSLEKLILHMNPHARNFLKMQLNLCKKKKNARRYTIDEKVLCLSIMKQSPKCYRFLSRIFILPSKSTLNEMIAKLVIKPGINPQVINLLKNEVNSWNSKKKMCSLIFDEISLDAALTYDKHNDAISGYVHLAKKTNEIADHALVFLLRGAVYKWQQPLCFYFCKGATSAIDLKNILHEVIAAVTYAGLNPVALVCDQGAAFQSAINNIKKDTKRNQILQNDNPDDMLTIGDVHLNIIFDPSHLIKGLRNNFLTKNIKLDGKLSKWQDILDVYETDCNHTESRMLHKLNDQCVVPSKIKKMKVKNCVKVLSSTVAAALNYTANFATYVDGRQVSSTLRNTAETVLFLDKLFDSVNGTSTMSHITKGKPLRQAVQEGSKHHEFWVEAIKKLQGLKFVNSKGEEKSVPSVKNFITTLKSYMNLWQLFKKNKINCLRPRYFNSDPIENFFGQVRAYNYRNNEPNCHIFTCTFKSLLITRLIQFHSESFNCEDDSAELILNLKTIFESNTTTESSHPKAIENNFDSVLESARRERINMHSRAYTAGWVVKKVLSGVNCHECQNSLTTPVSFGIHDWIGHREYTAAEKKRLNYPSEGAVRCFSTVIKETNNYLENCGYKENVSKKIKKFVLNNYSFNFNDCTEHKERILHDYVTITVRFSIMNWCSVINKILKGTDVIRLSRTKSLPPMQRKAYNKYVKKLKNKSFNK